MKTPIINITFLFIALFLYTKLVGPIPFSVTSIQTTKTDFFRVEGVGKATAIPNTALISLGVTKTAPSVLEAQNQLNQAVNKIINDLKNLGIEEKNIKTTNYSVYPNYDYTKGKQTVNTYTVTQNLEVQIKPIEKANQAIDAATIDGANIVNGATFILDEQSKKQLEEKARKEAVVSAKEKAQNLANAAGIHLGKIVDIEENASQPKPILMRSLAPLGNKAENQTNLTPGENTITITINLAYELY